MRLIMLIAIILLLSGFASADDGMCAEDGFRDSCNCVSSKGSNCWEIGKAKGIACMGVTYPVATAKYWIGECKTLQHCVDQLQSCTNAYCSGSDKDKCASIPCKECQNRADKCAYMARSCSGCGDGTCDKSDGETQETCCLDCGCPGGSPTLVCESEYRWENPRCTVAADEDLCFPYVIILPLLYIMGALAAKILLMA